MKFSLLSLLTALLLLVSAPVQAGSWTDQIVDWFTSLFAAEPDRTIEWTDEELDSLRTSPTGLLLNEVANADTLAINSAWPYESFNPASDLERHNRLLRETVLLTRPGNKLPFRSPTAIRIVYRQDQRPARMIAMARRFADVQEVPFDDIIGTALPIGLELPTIIVADDPVGQSSFNADWYHALYGAKGGEVTLIHFGDPALLKEVPRSWSVINTPLRSKESEDFLAQALFGAELIDGKLKKSTPVYSPGAG